MARADFVLPEDFMEKVSKLGEKTDDILSRVLEAGGEVALDAVRERLTAVIGTGKTPSKSTGELVAALGVSPARLDKNGNMNVKIGFDEPRKDGGSNAKIANILEYGRHNQPPKPFLKPAKAASRTAVVETMKAKLEEELSAL